MEGPKKSRWRGWVELSGDSDEEVHTSVATKRVVPSVVSESFIVDDVLRALDRKVGKRTKRPAPAGRVVDESALEDDAWEFQEHARKRGRGGRRVRGPTSAAYAERTKGGERAITNRLHGGHDALAAQGPTPLVDRVMAVLKLSVVPREVPCRGTHEKAIRDLLLLRIRTGASEMVYIAGQPGTGKTLTVLRVVETLIAMRDKDKLPPFTVASINALNDLSTPQSLFSHLYALLTRETLNPDKACRELTNRYFGAHVKQSPIYLLLLVDELDSLLGKGEKGEKVLHTLVEWVSRPHSRLLLVGIANTIDLSQRVRQRTQSRFEGESIVFQPYNASDILEILLSRLRSVVPDAGQDDPPPIFSRQALEICARKTANVSGDIRRALHLCHMAVDRLKTRLQSGQTQEPLISITHMSECLMAMRTTPFATLVQNASLFEKVFLIAVAREMAASGTQETTFDAALTRVSLLLPLVTPPLEDPGTSVWETVCNSLLCSRVLVARSYHQRRFRVLGVGVDEADDILFHLKDQMETDPILKQLLPLAAV